MKTRCCSSLGIPGPLSVIWIRPAHDSLENVKRRLTERVEEGYCGGCTTPEEYFNVKARFQAPPVPHLELESWPRNKAEECAEQALEYIFKT